MLVHSVVPHLHTGGQILLIEHFMEEHDASDQQDFPPMEQDFCQLSQPFQPKPLVCEELNIGQMFHLVAVSVQPLAIFHHCAIASSLFAEPPPVLKTAHWPTAFSLRGPPAA